MRTFIDELPGLEKVFNKWRYCYQNLKIILKSHIDPREAMIQAQSQGTEQWRIEHQVPNLIFPPMPLLVRPPCSELPAASVVSQPRKPAGFQDCEFSQLRPEPLAPTCVVKCDHMGDDACKLPRPSQESRLLKGPLGHVELRDSNPQDGGREVREGRVKGPAAGTGSLQTAQPSAGRPAPFHSSADQLHPAVSLPTASAPWIRRERLPGLQPAHSPWGTAPAAHASTTAAECQART